MDEYDLKRNLLHVRDENANLNVIISKPKSMMNYELFHLDESFHGILKTMPIWEKKKEKNCKKIQICLREIYSILFTKVHNLVKKNLAKENKIRIRIY